MDQSASDFDMHGGRAFRMVLSQINPELGMMFSLGESVIRSVGSMSTMMLGLAGGAAVLAGIAMLYKEIADNAARAAEAEERRQKWLSGQAESGEKTRARLELEAQAMGLPGQGPRIQQAAVGIAQLYEAMQGPAESAAKAMAFRRARGEAFDTGQYLAGITMLGGKVPELADPRKAAGEIRAVLTAGEKPESAAAQAGAREAMRGAAIQEEPAEASLWRRELNLQITRMRGRREFAKLSEEEWAGVTRIAREIPFENIGRLLHEAGFAMRSGASEEEAAIAAAQNRDIFGGGMIAGLRQLSPTAPAGLKGAATQRELIQAGREARAAAVGRYGQGLTEPGEIAPGAHEQPVIINNFHNHKETNIDRIEAPGGARSALISGVEAVGGNVQE